MGKRRDGRELDEMRKIKVTKEYIIYPEGSVLIEIGNTKVICNVTVEDKVPKFLIGKGKGWITAEYNMLPRSTHTRMLRDISKLKKNGRSLEIQRLIGRCLRGAVDLELLGEKTLIVDCDVVQADGGTRTASITGGFMAIKLACNKLLEEGKLEKTPIKNGVVAVSVGIVDEKPMLDLCYEEDSRADVDMNICMTDKGRFLELQGGGEKGDFSKNELIKLMELGEKGCKTLFNVIEEMK